MRPTRTPIIFVLMFIGLLGAYWVARAQEGRSLWAPPPSLPPDDSSPPIVPSKKKDTVKPVVPPVPGRPLPLQDRPKAQPSLPPILDVPGPTSKKIDTVKAVDPPKAPGRRLLVQDRPKAQPSLPPILDVPGPTSKKIDTVKAVDVPTVPGVPLPLQDQPTAQPNSPPTFDVPVPTLPDTAVDPQSPILQVSGTIPPPAPAIPTENAQPSISAQPAPLPKVTNINTTDDSPPPAKKGGDVPPSLPLILPKMDGPKKPAAVPIDPVQPLPAPKESPKPDNASQPIVIPQPMLPKADNASQPIVIPQPMLDPANTPATDPVSKETPRTGTTIQKPAPTPLVFPKSKPSAEIMPAPTTVPDVISPEARNSDRPKAFMRIRPASPKNSDWPPSQPVTSQPMPLGQQLPGLSPAPLSAIVPSGPRAANDPAAPLVQLQTPTLIVEKRALASLRPGETMQYQISVRNLGSIPAQQVRIEDELPADAKLLGADPAPLVHGNKAIWILPALAPQRESFILLTLQAGAAKEWTNQLSVHVSAANFAIPQTQTFPSYGNDRKGDGLHPSSGSLDQLTNSANNQAMRSRTSDALAIRLQGPSEIFVGKPAIFEIRVTNQSSQPLRDLVLYGFLPEGLNTPEGRTIQGAVDGLLQPGETKNLKMPANAVQPGRYSIEVKVAAHNTQEVSATATIEIGADNLLLHADPNTRLLVGREGNFRMELTNHTSRILRNVMVVSNLMDGLEFVSASDRGLYQANSRAVHWLIDQLPPGRTQTLAVRVLASKVGQFKQQASAKADGIAETQSHGVITVEGLSDLSLKVIDRDNPLEIGRESVYEIQVANPGTTPTTNVKLQVQFPPGLLPRNAQGATRHALDKQAVVFEPIAALGPQGQAIYRVSAVGQSVGNDQRIRFAVVSDQVRTPITREIGVMVYRD